jgi:protein disulfide-isomerase A6
LFSSESSVVIADVDADKYKSIGEEFKIEGFPTLKLFKKDAKSTPIECNGERTLLSLLSYLNSQLGTQRAKTGRLNNFAGLLEPLDQKVKDFMTSVNKEDTIKSWKNELATLVADVDSPYKEFALNYYIHAAEKISKKGIAYVRKESQRLTKLLEKDQDALGGKDKVDSIQMRKNILAVFAGDVKKYYNAKPGPGVVGTAGFADSVSKEEL